MHDNVKIIEWILKGRLPKDLSKAERKAYGVFTYRNYKPISDSEAVVLLSVLVERGYGIGRLQWDGFGKDSVYYALVLESPTAVLTIPYCHTIASAITTAILQLIERQK